MELNPLPVWVAFLCLTLLVRRMRRIRARLPIVGFVGLLLGLATCAAVRMWLRPGPCSYADAVSIHIMLVIASSFAMLAVVAWLRAFWRQDIARLCRAVRRERAWVLTCAALGLAAAGAYFAFGARLAARGALDRYDTLFWSDPERFSHIFNGTADEREQVTHKHPLTPLVGHAAFQGLRMVVGRHAAPLAVSSLAGGICVALAAAYFRSVSGSRGLGALLSILLGGTAGHVVFGAIPESYTLSAATLILLHFLLAKRAALTIRLRHWAVAAVLAIGMTLSNAVPALFCYLAHRRARSLHRWTAAVVLLGGALLALQDSLMPQHVLGRTPMVYAAERHYVRHDVPPQQAARNLVRGLLLDSVVGPSPRVVYNGDYPIVYTGVCDTWLGRIAASGWIVSLLVAVAVLLRTRAAPPTLWAVLVCLLVTAITHSIYGNAQIFLYSCTYTFYVVAIVGHAVRHLPRRAAVIALAMLGAVVLSNNIVFCTRILQTLDRIAT